VGRFVGDSQAWRAVYIAIGRDAPAVDTPAALHHTIAAMEAEQSTWPTQAEATVRLRITELASRAEQLRTRANVIERETEELLAERVDDLQRQLDRLESAVLPLRVVWELFRVPAIRRELDSLLAEPAQLTRHLHIECDKCQHERHRIESHLPDEIARETELLRARLNRLRKAATSPELAGAVAELAVIDELRALPDTFVVLSGLELDLGRYVRFDNGRLRTAQADHIVVGPTGIFVIETKNWSRAFAESGEYFDPFQQVNRARFLCQCLARRSVPGVTARSIIAGASAVPGKKGASYAKVLRPPDLPGYIRWFQASLQEAEVAATVDELLPYLPRQILPRHSGKPVS
jgi:hypothetical protein